MEIYTIDGWKRFGPPMSEPPQYTAEHIARVRDMVEHRNSMTIAGWERKYPVDPQLVLSEQLEAQVVLTHVPNNDPFDWARTKPTEGGKPAAAALRAHRVQRRTR